MAACALAMGLAACAGPSGPTAADAGYVRAADAPPLPDSILLADVPFVAQPDWQCGPASLAMVMASAGRPVPVATLAEGTFVPDLQGSLQAEMLAATRRQKMLAAPLPPTFDAVRAELADGRPVVVLLNLGLSIRPLWHYAVVIGYDLAAGEVLLHSGDTPSMRMRRFTFDRTWARGGHWAIAVTPPSRLPASVDDRGIARAALGLERVDAAAAAAAWDALVERWPRSRIGRFGRANLALARGDARAAAADLRAATDVDPSFADAWNNLARALDAAGERDAARDAADRAVALGGPHADAYRETRASLGR